MAKIRLDHLLVERGLAESGEQARRYILAGLVRVEGVERPKPGHQVRTDVQVVVSQPERYVSRGAYKLIRALDEFGVEVTDRVALDLGASTGGFTQVLLERGARQVYALDVGQAQMHQTIRSHPQVVVMEHQNARFMTKETLPGPMPDLVTADLSFISLTKVLPAVGPIVGDGSDLIVLVKPQFEATKEEVSRARGVITDPAIWRRALELVIGGFLEQGISALRICRSPIAGGSGNVEFLLHGKKQSPTVDGASDQISGVVDDLAAG
jgi:23S rRNA (cytidine1920-2'-O)/16S rRNA (cytidine1409-2'-O)-methyltransferase